MNTLTMMYVYFDTLGDIKSISPDANQSMLALYTVTTVPLPDVEGFLTGKKNPFNYFVKSVNRLGTLSYKIVRKEVAEVSNLRNIDTFLTEVAIYSRTTEPTILIENFTDSKKLRISINPAIKCLREDGTDSEIEQLTTVFNTPSIYLFFTKRSDPYYLVDTITISPRELFEKDNVYIKYTTELKNTSVFTKKW